MTQTAQHRQLNTVKSKDKVGVRIAPSWKLAIADAESRIAQLRRSIELFKQYDENGIPFPNPTTRN